jgi:hypothetical protein
MGVQGGVAGLCLLANRRAGRAGEVLKIQPKPCVANWFGRCSHFCCSEWVLKVLQNLDLLFMSFAATKVRSQI